MLSLPGTAAQHVESVGVRGGCGGQRGGRSARKRHCGRRRHAQFAHPGTICRLPVLDYDADAAPITPQPSPRCPSGVQAGCQAMSEGANSAATPVRRRMEGGSDHGEGSGLGLQDAFAHAPQWASQVRQRDWLSTMRPWGTFAGVVRQRLPRGGAHPTPHRCTDRRRSLRPTLCPAPWSGTRGLGTTCACS